MSRASQFIDEAKPLKVLRTFNIKDVISGSWGAKKVVAETEVEGHTVSLVFLYGKQFSVIAHKGKAGSLPDKPMAGTDYSTSPSAGSGIAKKIMKATIKAIQDGETAMRAAIKYGVDNR